MADDETIMPSKEGMDTASEMSAFQKWEHGMIEDIGHDTDALIKMLGGKSMTESYDSGLLTGMLANKGVDPSLIAMLKNNEGAFGGDSGMLFLLFLVILMGGGSGFGFNGNGIDRTVINEGNFNQLMTAITSSGQSQTAAVQALANNLNTDVSQVTSALAQVDKQIAVNQGSITNAIQSCCCNVRTSILEQSNLIERGLNGLQNQASQIAYAQQDNDNRNTQSILNAITAQSALIHDGFCDIRTRELEAEVSRLRDLNSQQRDAANTQAILTAIANMNEVKWSGVVDGTNVSGTGTLS